MSWTRGLLALLAVCVLMVTGSVSCGADGARKQKDGRSVSPVGKVLDDTDHEGRHYREVDKENAPGVGIVVQPDTDDSWSVRLTVENFTFSPAATKAKAVSGRGVAVLFVDDRPVTTLRAPSCHLPAAYVPQGTHKLTARLYADDGTVWAVDGTPVESTADVTASEPRATGGGGSESEARSPGGGVSGAPSVGSADVASSSRSFTSTAGGGWGSPSFTSTAGGGWGSPSFTSTATGATGSRLRASECGGGVSAARPAVRVGGGIRGPQVGAGTGGAVSDAGLAATPGGGVLGLPLTRSAGGGVW
ncbi:hypothetical protein ABZT06_25150 [Streptomyces sp. NPDC005483]|uniref:hypothetical protein n=1 Tax=Streptomyces sp. NPDC005483 TaxID=3154882 RepID=UPI0033B57C80